MLEMSNKYKVAVVCHTYNHEKYISKAIESFLSQITTFDIQIIIHDDASTDRTPNIVMDFKHKFPDIIFPVFQSENQFSKRAVGYIEVFKSIKSLIDSQYVAFCEGDDYWTDENKLTKQINIIENNTSYSAISHPALLFDENRKTFVGVQSKTNKPKNFDTTDFILGGGGLIPSGSLLTRSDFFVLPEFGLNLSFLDYQNQIQLSIFGKVHHMSDIMSVYRINVKNSWTYIQKHLDKKEENVGYNSMLEMLDELNLVTSSRYIDIIALKKISILLESFTRSENSFNKRYLILIKLLFFRVFFGFNNRSYIGVVRRLILYLEINYLVLLFFIKKIFLKFDYSVLFGSSDK